jgi:hypothetical protein
MPPIDTTEVPNETEGLKVFTDEEVDSKDAIQSELEAVTTVTLSESVTVGSSVKITPVEIETPESVVYTPYDGTEVGNDLVALNKPTESLKNSVNSNITNTIKTLETVLEQFGLDVSKVNSNIRSETNSAMAVLLTDIKKVYDVAVNAQEKVKALDAVYSTDADISKKTAELIDINEKFKAVDTEFFNNFKKLVNHVNQAENIQTKSITISASDGSANVNLRLLGFGEFLSIDDYQVKVERVSLPLVDAFIPEDSITAEGFDINLISKKYIIDRVHNAEAEPVKVTFSISHKIKDPFTIGQDALNSNSVLRESEVPEVAPEA